jgi:hypothetical protein
MSQPVLAIYGTQDAAIPVVDSSRKLAVALERGGNRGYTIRFFAEADHELRVGGGGLAPGYMETMVAWIGGLPATAQPPPGLRLAGGTPTQRYEARAAAAPRYGTGAALALESGLACVGLLAGPVATLVARRRRRESSELFGDAEVWRGIRRSVRRLVASAISTHLAFNLVVGAGIALALARTSAPLIVNGGWLVARIAALATVALGVASLDAAVSAIRHAWTPTGAQRVSLVGAFGGTGMLLMIAAHRGLFAPRW